MIRKTVVALLAAIIVLCFVMPAAAETFIPEDGVISIDLPNENWKKIEDVTKYLTFSDGANQITIEHFSNGEKLPPISVADSHYVNVFQAAFSTQNEVFVVTGSVVDAAKIPEVTQAIMSLKVLKYDTKRAVSSQPQTGTSEFTVVPMDKTMYVTADSLNVRKGCSTDTQLLGGYKKGSQVKVTGSVQRNGVDLGWYQVNYEGGTGYVSSEFLSDTAPASTGSSSGSSSGSNSGSSSGSSSGGSSSVYTGNVITVYDETGDAYTLYQNKNGLWYDNSGTAYSRLSEEDFQVWEGMKRLSIYYTGPDNHDYSDQEGEGNLQYCYDCGQWFEAGEEFDNHNCPGKNNSSSDNNDYSDQEGEGNMQYCYDCGQWFEAGEAFDNHYCPGKNNSSSDNYDYSDQEGEGNLQYCWRCGQWFEAGEEFDNHYCP